MCHLSYPFNKIRRRKLEREKPFIIIVIIPVKTMYVVCCMQAEREYFNSVICVVGFTYAHLHDMSCHYDIRHIQIQNISHKYNFFLIFSSICS